MPGHANANNCGRHPMRLCYRSGEQQCTRICGGTQHRDCRPTHSFERTLTESGAKFDAGSITGLGRGLGQLVGWRVYQSYAEGANDEWKVRGEVFGGTA